MFERHQYHAIQMNTLSRILLLCNPQAQEINVHIQTLKKTYNAWWYCKVITNRACFKSTPLE